MPGIEDRINGEVPLGTAADAASLIEPDDTVTVSGFGSVGYPKAVPLALAQGDRELDLTLISGGTLGYEIDVELVEAGQIARRFPHQTRQTARDRINAGEMAYHDRHSSRVGTEVALGNFGSIDVAIIEAVAVGADWLVPSMSIGMTPAFVASADRLVVEVNAAQSRRLQRVHDVYWRGLPPDQAPIPLASPDDRIGGPKVTFDANKLDVVVRTDRPDDGFEFREPTDVFRTIASNLGSFLAAEMDRNPALEDAIYFQFGVGSLGNALMESLAELSFEGRDVAYFGEVIQDGLLSLIRSGTFSAASATAIALSDEGQREFVDNIDEFVDDIVLRPAAVSNAPALIERFGVVAINSALEVDVYGNVNATHIGGSHVVNGIGGSSDFSRHSPVAVIALPSTTRDGSVSRVVPMVPHVDNTEHDVDVIVTEHGVADLRGLAPRERAPELVENCAHPSFRSDLRSYLERGRSHGGHVPTDLQSAFSWTEAGTEK